jgi:WD40 repeat protein
MVSLEGQTIWSRPWVLGESLFWDSSGTFLVTDWLKDKIMILDARTGKTWALLNVPYTGKPDLRPSPRAVTFSPDQSLLVTLDSNETLRYFDLKSRQELEVPPAMRDGLEAQFTPDGRLLIRSRDGLAFWNLPKR